MMPTKPMSPLTDTAAAVPRVAAATTIRRTRDELDPQRVSLVLADSQHVEQTPVREQDHAHSA